MNYSSVGMTDTQGVFPLFPDKGLGFIKIPRLSLLLSSAIYNKVTKHASCMINKTHRAINRLRERQQWGISYLGAELTITDIYFVPNLQNSEFRCFCDKFM